MNQGLAGYLLLAVAVGGSMAIFQAVYRLFAPPPQDTSLVTLARQPGEGSSFDALKDRGGLLDRFDYLLALRLGLGAKLEELHMLMGRPEKPSPLDILHRKELCALLLPAFLAYMMEAPAALALAPFCFWLPDFYYRSKVAERQREIVRSFPAMVDLAALTIESGLDYMSAFDRITKFAKRKTELELEMDKAIAEVGLGYSRREALRRMATRTGLQDVRSFVGLIIQSDELGTSLVDLLRNFSQDLRFRRLNKAEKAAAQASTKMLFPIFIFIFPTVFILTLAPMLVNLFKGGIGF